MHNREHTHNKQSDLYQHCTIIKKNKCRKSERPSAERSTARAPASDEEVESIQKFNQATKLPFYCLSLLHTEHPGLKIFGMECADGSVLMY